MCKFNYLLVLMVCSLICSSQAPPGYNLIFEDNFTSSNSINSGAWWLEECTQDKPGNINSMLKKASNVSIHNSDFLRIVAEAQRKALAIERMFSTHANKCPHCHKGTMIIRDIFAPNKDPPSLRCNHNILISKF